jgi:hypothetical protein
MGLTSLQIVELQEWRSRNLTIAAIKYCKDVLRTIQHAECHGTVSTCIRDLDDLEMLLRQGDGHVRK